MLTLSSYLEKYSLQYYYRYLYFYEKGVPQITVESIQDLIELIRNEMQGKNSASDPANAFLASTLRYIEFQKDKGGAVGEKYKLITVWLPLVSGMDSF